jgi:hypothetical protein
LPLDLLPEKPGSTLIGEKFKGIGKTGKGDKESGSKKPVSRVGETPEEHKLRKVCSHFLNFFSDQHCFDILNLLLLVGLN